MATAKKTTKKAAVKRAPAKATAKTSVKRVAKPAEQPIKSFHVAPREESFFTLRITKQTVYWAILAIIVLALGLWVIDINDRVQRIYDQIDTMNEEALSTPATPKKTPAVKTTPQQQ